VLGHQFSQDLILGLHLLLQELDPFLLLLDLTGGRSFDWKAEAPFSKNSFRQR
jgi:hypothetical protein